MDFLYLNLIFLKFYHYVVDNFVLDVPNLFHLHRHFQLQRHLNQHLLFHLIFHLYLIIHLKIYLLFIINEKFLFKFKKKKKENLIKLILFF